MNSNALEKGAEELRTARSKVYYAVVAVFIFSIFANLLMLTGPLYMLQVYDRVLTSKSEQTLIALSLIVLFLFVVMGVLDYIRTRVMTRVGAKFSDTLNRRVFESVVRRSAQLPDLNAETGLKSLENIRQFLASPMLIALIDLPWTPLFLFGIYLFHPWLGYLAIGSALFLLLIAGINQVATQRKNQLATRAVHKSDLMSEQIRVEAETVQSMGMLTSIFDRWQNLQDEALSEQTESAEKGTLYKTISKVFRMIVQSAMLGLAAYLVLQAEVTPGVMIASSILLGRALAPIETIVASWPVLQSAHRGWKTLAALLAVAPPLSDRTELPAPPAHLSIKQLSVAPPGQSRLALKGPTFTVESGTAVAVIGPSGSGKSTLARALTGLWQPYNGEVRLGQFPLNQYHPDKLGQYVGYLPQRIHLFEGTIAENIARFADEADDSKVVAAAMKADAHQMISELPDGYDTIINANGGQLSGGQMQRIGLARALYSDPIVLVLDEPNSSLDSHGSMALNRAIRSLKEEGCIVMIMAHRPAALSECEKILILSQGMMVDYGPRDEVLQKYVTNHDQLNSPGQMGGVI
ncbi:type I secretion system permease/ATPase [uncultured Ruegeria sp.]|uniref:type I secretion system permease/ATPase n=1 Tax=uncultured Ruegeria sp. TaxID=259304 RepID=UPI002612A6A5|nr:type I secretion system permease/ATPase [uncultured Ruegeria sp.]